MDFFLQSPKVATWVNYDILVEQKRKQLINKSQEHIQIDTSSQINIQLSIKSPDYPARVEEYLSRYREYLESHYLYSVHKDRLRFFYPAIENKGRHPANDAKIEFVIPGRVRLPTKDELLWAREEEDGEFAPQPPPEPELIINPLKSIGDWNIATGFPLLHSALPPPQPPSNVQGPYYHQKDSATVIGYKIARLIPGQSEIDFEPFALWLGDIIPADVLEIPVRISAAELPEPETDSLLIEFQISGISASP